MDKHVSIIFCGGCNSHIDRGRLAGEIRDCLAGLGCHISYNNRDAEFLIYLSGCSASCASRYSNVARPCTVIAAGTIDAAPCGETALVAETVKRVEKYFASVE